MTKSKKIAKDNVIANEKLPELEKVLISEQEKTTLLIIYFVICKCSELALKVIHNNNKLNNIEPYFSSILVTAHEGVLPVLGIYDIKK